MLAAGRKSYLRSSSAVLLGSVAGQVVFLAVSPLLTRRYPPAAFGVAGVFTAVLAMASTPANGRYHLAIAIPESPLEARALLRLSMWFTPPAAAAMGALFLGYLQLTGYGGGRDRLLAGTAMALAVALFGVAAAYQALLGRIDAFTDVGWSRAGQGVVNTVVSLGLGTAGSAGGLVAGQLAGQGAAGAVAGIGLWRLRRQWCVPGRMPLWPLARRYSSFPLLSTPAGVMNSLGVQAPVLLIPLLFSIQSTGIYALSYRMIIAPAAMLTMALATVFQGSAPDAHRDGRLLGEITRIVNVMTRVALPLTVALVIAGPLVATVLFGDEWKGAGRLFQLLAPWFLVIIVVAPLSPTFTVLEQLRRDLVFQTSLVVSRVVAVLIGGLAGSFELGVALSSAVTVAHYLVFLHLVARALDGTVRRLLAPVVPVVVRSTAAVAVALLAVWLLPGSATEITPSGVAVIAVAALFVLSEAALLARSTGVRGRRVAGPSPTRFPLVTADAAAD
ncbi:MAG: oligosaccharide flippase family protein [Acidimicrobiales bacterium]